MAAKPSPDTTVASVARRQAGVFSRNQALAAGLSPRQVHQRLSSGTWTSLLTGVYALSAIQVSWLSWAWAGILSAGPGSVLIAGSAAAVRGWTPQSWPITIAVPRERRMRWPTSRLSSHRFDVPPVDIVRVEGLPVTVRLRTAADIAHLLPLAQAQELLDRLLVLEVVDLTALTQAISQSTRHGCRQAKRLMASAADLAASEAERMVQALFRSQGLDWFEANYRVMVAGHRLVIDLAFVRERVAIEVKGWAFHSLPDRGRMDGERETDLQLAGWLVIPVTWFDLVSRPQYVVARVRQALAQRAVA